MFPFAIPFPYKIAFFALIIGAAFLYGYQKGSNKSDVQIANYQKTVATLQLSLEREAANIKERVVTEYVDKIQTVKEKQYVYIKQAAEVVPSQYYLSNGWVYLHDHVASSQNGIADATRVADATASDIKDNQALAAVVDNYGICKQNAEQLIALQDYIKKVKDAIDKNNKSVAKQ